MKKIRTYSIFALLVLAFHACKKEDIVAGATTDVEEAQYKTQFMELTELNKAVYYPHTKTGITRMAEDLPVANIRLDFKTYKEAYTFFNNLRNSHPENDKFSLNTLAQTDATTGASEVIEYQGNDGTVVRYSATPIVVVPLQNTLGFFSVGIQYDINMSVAYSNLPPKRQILSHVISNNVLVYSGAGETLPMGLPFVKKETDEKGSIKGLVQVKGSISDTPFSMIIRLNGSYTVEVPTIYPAEPVIIKTSLSASMY